VYGYLGNRTGPADKGWYSFDLGTWHVIVLNTSDWQWGAKQTFGIDAATGAWVPSEQVDWLAQDLANNKQQCIMVISWERRIYTTSSGTRGRQGNMLRIGSMLYNAGVDVLVSAKDKIFARFPQTDHQGTKDEARGFRQFIVGTGGRSFDNAVTPKAVPPEPISPVEVQNDEAWGVLKFTLDPTSYSWQFIPTVPGGFTDSGTTACH